MKIRIKERGIFGDKRTEIACKIDDIMVKEDLLNPESERILLFFRHGIHSGLLELSHKETEALFNSVRKTDRLIGKTKKII